MTFVAHNTPIPVPRVLDWSVDDDGTASLTMEAVEGRTLEEFRDSDDLNQEEKALLMRNVESFMDDIVFPQLATLRSGTIGQLAGVLFFPPHVAAALICLLTPTMPWLIRQSRLPPSDTPSVTIHSDSFEVKYILDWEYAGFFPPGFEFLYWRYSLQGYREWDNDPRRYNDGIAKSSSREGR